jgi:hypothetical protein
LVHRITLDDIDPDQTRQDIHFYLERSLDGSSNTWAVQESWTAHPEDVDYIANRGN